MLTSQGSVQRKGSADQLNMSRVLWRINFHIECVPSDSSTEKITHFLNVSVRQGLEVYSLKRLVERIERRGERPSVTGATWGRCWCKKLSELILACSSNLLMEVCWSGREESARVLIVGLCDLFPSTSINGCSG